MKLSICPFERLFPKLEPSEQDLSWCCNDGSLDCPLINKAIDYSHSYGTFIIKEPEFDISIVNK